MRAKCQSGQGSIPIPTPTPIQTMVWWIGNHSYPYPYTYPYTYPPHHRVRVRVPLRCVRVRFWAELEDIRKGPWRSELGVGVAIGLGIGRTGPGIRRQETGCRNRIISVPTQHGSAVWAGQAPTRTGIDSDPDPDPDSDNDRTDRPPFSGSGAGRNLPFRTTTSCIGAVFSNNLGLLKRPLSMIPSKAGAGHGTNPFPWSGHKRHRALCGRLSGWAWGGQVGSGDLFG